MGVLLKISKIILIYDESKEILDSFKVLYVTGTVCDGNMDIGNHKFTYMKEKYDKTSFIEGNNDF